MIGVNLLREGLDLPEVSLVAIMDADKEGFLRSATSLIQTIGRSARNVNAEVYLYADKITDSMAKAIGETNRRRELQKEYNEKHGITPTTIKKAIKHGIEEEIRARNIAKKAGGISSEKEFVTLESINEVESKMLEAADALDFELAAQLRDRLLQLKQSIGQEIPEGDALTPGFAKKKKGRKKKTGRKGTGQS